MDLTGFRVTLPILSAWKDIIPTYSEHLKTCKVFSSLHEQTVQVLRKTEALESRRGTEIQSCKRHEETCTVAIKHGLPKKKV